MMHSCSQKRMIVWRLCVIFSIYYSILISASSGRHLCRPDQRDALWEFKSEFYVQKPDFHWSKSDSKTVKWRNNTDCCSWDGISCDSKSGVVVELDLEDSFLNGPLRTNSSLFRLQHLQRLNLGRNNLSGILPNSISNLKYLRTLTLFGCNFFGKIPSSLGYLSYLTDLDLMGNDFTGEIPDSLGNLNRLTRLILGHNKLNGNFPLVLLNMSELIEIDLLSNRFEGMLPSNMSSLCKLEFFDVSGNSFSGSIPSSLFMIPSLTYLLLQRNDFSGPLEIRNISSPSKVETLSLGENNFNGPISGSISKLSRLSYLDLSFWNTGKRIVDFSIFMHLKSLQILDLSNLNTRSIVDLSLFSNLMSLRSLDLSGNTLKISPTLHLSSPIQQLLLSSCNIVEFPKFLQTKTNLSYLDMSANQIEGKVPEWLWRFPELVLLDISSNTFHDPFPLLPRSLVHFLGSDNRFSGKIPHTICELVALETLVLSNNNFSGSIPKCFQNFNTTLSVLHLQNNSLTGVFPEESINDHLISLDIGRNHLSGELPKSLINCTELEFLNVENNRINGNFPFWLRLFPNLQVLVLRSNEFHGPISSHGDSLSFSKLRIFDISDNLFSGVLPSDYFAGWAAMSSVVNTEGSTLIRFGRHVEYYHASVVLTNKGLKMELVGSGFTMYKTIDVSGNRFEGEIPKSIGLLEELIVLNMSNNAFTGHIPPSLVNLTNLQSLDLSQNRLSGEIPPELGKLTFLARMNFSYNRLEGPIPQGTQIQSQNSSSFAENHGLCGVPLQETCGGEEEATKQEEDEEKEEEEDQALSWIAAALGYVPGLFCGLTIGYILTSYKHD
ncbi:receptor-like protein 12 [Eutrema salsugineum]|uniref:receptor-like protein 12 n=1 Tax=Eutrema salsugineum TaxID=72664 RepID=UPI000CED6C98|nr:receptor-like protein 12 [Eutrema salsugineum]